MIRFGAVPALAGLCVLAAGCVGTQQMTLDVKSDLTVRNKPGSAETFIVSPGSYAMKLSLGLANSKITLVSSSGQKAAFSIKSASQLKDIFKTTESAHASVSGAQLLQAFDIDVKKTKNVVNQGPDVQKYVSCLLGYHTEYQTHCYPGTTVCHGDHHHQVCYQEPGYCQSEAIQVADYGSRMVVGHDTTYQTTTQLKLVQDGATKAVSRPTAIQFSEWMQTFAGECR